MSVRFGSPSVRFGSPHHGGSGPNPNTPGSLIGLARAEWEIAAMHTQLEIHLANAQQAERIRSAARRRRRH